VGHISREANEAMHCLANVALRQLLEQSWMEKCPIFIQNIVLINQDIYIFFFLSLMKA